MMNNNNIFNNKNSALVVLNTMPFKDGEIVRIKYYSQFGQVDSLVAVGVKQGVGQDCYTLIADQSLRCVTAILSYIPDVVSMIPGSVYLYNDPTSNKYSRLFLLDDVLIQEEVTESFYFTNLDDGKYYFFDSTPGSQRIVDISHNLTEKSSFQGIINTTVEGYSTLLSSRLIKDDHIYLLNDGDKIVGLMYNYMPFKFDYDFTSKLEEVKTGLTETNNRMDSLLENVEDPIFDFLNLGEKENLGEAISSIPEDRRKLGLEITFKSQRKWKDYKFLGSHLGLWGEERAWVKKGEWDELVDIIRLQSPLENTTYFAYNPELTLSYYPLGWDSIQSYCDISGNTRKEVGTQEVTVSLKDKNNTAWEDESTNDKVFTFEVHPRQIFTPELVIDIQGEYKYTGSPIIPEINIQDGEYPIPESDYQITLYDNTNSGEASVMVTLSGNYEGSGSAKFSINKATDVLVTPPTAREGLVSGILSNLVNPGETKYEAKIFYKLGEIGEWSEEIPKSSTAGDFIVYWKIQETQNYLGVTGEAISIHIEEAKDTNIYYGYQIGEIDDLTAGFTPIGYVAGENNTKTEGGRSYTDRLTFTVEERANVLLIKCPGDKKITYAVNVSSTEDLTDYFLTPTTGPDLYNVYQFKYPSNINGNTFSFEFNLI